MNVLVNDFVGGHVCVLIGVSGTGIRALVVSSLSLSQRFARSYLPRLSSLPSLCSSIVFLSRLGKFWLRTLLVCSEVGPGGSLLHYSGTPRVIAEDVLRHFGCPRQSREFCGGIVTTHTAVETLANGSRPERDLVLFYRKLHSTPLSLVLPVSEATILSASRKLEERPVSDPARCLLSCTYPAAQLSSPMTARTNPLR